MLHQFKDDKEKIKAEVKARVCEKVFTGSKSQTGVQEIVDGVVFHERERLRKHGKIYKNSAAEKDFYKELSRDAAKSSGGELKSVLERSIEHYMDEITGNFNPLVYSIATILVPRGLTLLLNTMSPLGILRKFPRIPSIENTMIVDGSVDKLRRLKEQGGVLIYVPEHLSNLDSPVMGFSLYKNDLPPVLYGAGLNLFQMPLFHLFMNNLGAYKVDRLKKSELYKSLLKEFAETTLERGYDHLFFPGGTRSRSGAIEQGLKKGLLGTPLKAFISSRLKREKKKYFVVPVTLSYHLVLEAYTLIEDHLKETGKSRYIILDDESSNPYVIYKFIEHLLNMEGKLYLHFCEPLDPFGNAVDKHGASIDCRGRKIDIEGYVKRRGKITEDDQRDRIYTGELEKKVIASFYANTYILCTHAVAYVFFKLLFRQSASGELFEFLKEEAYDLSVSFKDLKEQYERLAQRMIRLEKQNRIRLEPIIRTETSDFVINQALRYFRIFHRKPVIYRKKDRLYTRYANVLFYYRNRLTGYELE